MYPSTIKIAQTFIKELIHALKATWTIITKICSHLSWFTFFLLEQSACCIAE